MRLLKPTISQQFAPATIKLSDLYNYSTELNEPSKSVKKAMEKTLKGAGYQTEEIEKIIHKNKNLSTSEMKKVVGHLGDNKVFGFHSSAGSLVDNFLHHEAIKKSNLDQRKRELAVEARREPITSLARPAKKERLAKKKPVRYPF